MEWEYNSTADYNQIKKTAKKYNVSEIAAEIILSREIDDIDGFLNPDFSSLKDPFLFEHMQEVVSRIIDAKKNSEKIFVYGDYDVDGISSVTFLTLVLRNIGIEVDYYIPNRLDEGYGLNIEAIDYIVSEKGNLVITVDVGVNSSKEIRYAKDLGLDIIVTDHHKLLEDENLDVLIINPKLSQNYDFKYLSGSGVALKVAQALYQKLDIDLEWIYGYLDIVMLGTVADVVPLIDENRIIVKKGLEQINNTKVKGLRYLFRYLNLVNKEITTSDVSFFISPLLNALGRIKDSKVGVDFFLEDDEFNIYNIIEEMKSANSKRRLIERQIFTEIVNELEKGIENVSYIIKYSKNWHPGVIGVVAAKISLKYNIPVVLISVQDDIGKASCRSVSGINIFEILKKHSSDLIRFGGHDLAAGFVVATNRLDEIKAKISKDLDVKKPEEKLKIHIDMEIELSKISNRFLDELKVLAPYGLKNRMPFFLTKEVYFQDIIRFGIENQHFKLKVKYKCKIIEAVCFNLSYKLDNVISTAQKFEVVYFPEKVQFRGREFIQLKIKDFNPIDDFEEVFYKNNI